MPEQKTTEWQVPRIEVVRIPLGHGREALIDAVDYGAVSGLKWSVLKSRHSRTLYAQAYIPGGGGKRILLHRLILNVEAPLQVDHVDGDGLNCVRSNLRSCTGSQNCSNRERSTPSKSKYRGVWRRPDCSRFEAYIKVRQKRLYLGIFPTAESAAFAYNTAAVREFGEFAVLNEVGVVS